MQILLLFHSESPPIFIGYRKGTKKEHIFTNFNAFLFHKYIFIHKYRIFIHKTNFKRYIIK